MAENHAMTTATADRTVDRSEKVLWLKATAPFGSSSATMLEAIADQAELISLDSGQRLYQEGEPSDAIYVIIDGRLQHSLGPAAEATKLVREIGAGEVIGWAALLKSRPRRLASVKALSATRLLKIQGERLLSMIDRDPGEATTILSRFATMIRNDYTLPGWLAETGRPATAKAEASVSAPPSRLDWWIFQTKQAFKSSTPYLMMFGFAVFLLFWHLTVTVLELPRFRMMPGLIEVVQEYTSRDPIYGLSMFTPEYYTHIIVSIRRVFLAFALATVLGVSLGLLMGWSESVREYVFPVFETLRPIPILAWVPLAIIMFYSAEAPVIFLCFLASFYATALNTMLGVASIDESYRRAAFCLGANRWQEFRHVIIPGSLPFIFTGLQISVGVAWFSLVAAEMVSGEFGLGYVINTSYTTVRYPTIVIGMITLGAVGYITSAMVRVLGNYLMQWRLREQAMGGR
jgi:NitT/TauT family transport system permease protein